jgi:predicted Zn-dependent protease
VRHLIRRLPLATGLAAALSLAVVSASVAQPSADLAAKARRGQEAMAAGRFAEAAALYSEIVRVMPDEPGLRLNLGMALAMAGRSREAVPHLQTALRLRPDLFPASLFLGMAHMELGQPDRAVEPLEKFVAAQPDNREARQILADALLTLERPEAAARHFRTLTEQDPQDPRAWYGLGSSYEAVSGDAFEELQVSWPDSVEILLLVADLMVSQERDKSAFALYREALEKRPGMADVHEALAALYERSDHPDWAAVERDKARALPPPDCRSASLECDFRAGRYAAVFEAARSLQTAEGRYWRSRAAGELSREAFARLEQLPPSPEVTLVRVQVLSAQRRYRQSKEELQKAMEAWPEDPRIRRELASLLFIAREYDAARPILETLLRQAPDDPHLNILLGQVWLEQRQPAKAVPFLEKALAGDPERPHARAVLGRAYLDAGEAEKAVPHLEAARESDEDGSLHFQLARAYQATGQADRARQTRQAFQEIRRANAAREESEREELEITPP